MICLWSPSPHLTPTYWQPGYFRAQTDYLCTPTYTVNTAPWQPGHAHHHGHTQPQQFVWCACHVTASPPWTHWHTVAKREPTRGQKTQHGVETPSMRQMPGQMTPRQVDRPNVRSNSLRLQWTHIINLGSTPPLTRPPLTQLFRDPLPCYHEPFLY